MLNIKLIVDCEVDGINRNDAPDYCDAYISQAWTTEGVVSGAAGNVTNKRTGVTYRPLNDTELDWLNEQRELVYEQVENNLH